MNSKIYEKALNEKSQSLKLLENIVNFESFSGSKESVDKLSDYLSKICESLGGSNTFHKQESFGNNLTSEFYSGDKTTLILCHMDTVWPIGTLQQRPFTVEGNIAKGPGIFDMKVGISITLEAIRILNELGIKPQNKIKILFNSDEELGSEHSMDLIKEEALKSHVTFCLESSFKGMIKTARKGVGMYHLSIDGKAAHAGSEPENGISANVELAHQILKLNSFNNSKTGTTVNIGRAEGGVVRNQVPANAEALIDLRVVTNKDAIDLDNKIKSLESVVGGSTLEITGGMNRPPMERTEKIVKLYQWAKDNVSNMDVTFKETGFPVGGGSDGNFAASTGTPVLDGLGGVGDGAHAEHEYIEIDKFHEKIAILASLISNIHKFEI
jgi:glutamate carboxypeptidase